MKTAQANEIAGPAGGSRVLVRAAACSAGTRSSASSSRASISRRCRARTARIRFRMPRIRSASPSSPSPIRRTRRAPTATSASRSTRHSRRRGTGSTSINRPSPAKVDAGVTTVVAPSDLPSYPSEDAVLSGVTAEMLKLLFPAAVEEITRKAAEQREAAILSGRATASDVAAGLALGKAVAALVIARARRRRDEERRRHAAAVAELRRRDDRAGRGRVDQSRDAAPAAHAAQLRPGQDVDASPPRSSRRSPRRRRRPPRRPRCARTSPR